MAEDKNKQKPETLQDEQLDEVNGGQKTAPPPPEYIAPHGSFL